MRRAATLLVVAVTVGAVAGSGSARSALSVGGNFKKISATQAWGRAWAVGGTFYGFRMKGTDFTITSVIDARSSGGSAPTCTVTDGLLDCRGTFPDGSSLFVDFGISGSGSSFQMENFFNANPSSTPQLQLQNSLGPAFLPMTATLTGGASKTVTVSGKNAFDDIEVMPFGFSIGKVTASSPAASCKPEGPGVDCSLKLAAGKKATLTFTTTPTPYRAVAGAQSATPSAWVLAHGSDGTAGLFIEGGGGDGNGHDIGVDIDAPSTMRLTSTGTVGLVTFDVVVTNAGPASAHEVTLRLDLVVSESNNEHLVYPSFPSDLSRDCKMHGAVGHVVKCSWAEIGAGKSKHVHVVVKLAKRYDAGGWSFVKEYGNLGLRARAEANTDDNPNNLPNVLIRLIDVVG